MPRKPPPCSLTERCGAGGILLLFLGVALNAIHNGATHGQDFNVHYEGTQGVLTHPHKWFYLDVTSRPLLYWIGAACVRFSGGVYSYQIASILFAGLGALSLLLMHDASRRLISAPALRISALALIAFLPVTVVSTVVYAADTCGFLPFALTGWSLARCLEAESDRSALGYALLGCVALTAGDFAKATFGLLPAGILFAVIGLLRTGQISLRRSLVITVLTFVIPTGVAGWLNIKAHAELRNAEPRHTFDWKGTGELTFRSLILPKFSDRRILNAPTYWTPLPAHDVTGSNRLLLLVHNGFSYPALLHLGTFSDVLDFVRNDESHKLPRPNPQQNAARLAVRSGVLFSLLAFLAVIAFWSRMFASWVGRAQIPSPALLLWSALALAWFLPIAGALPFVHFAYDWGYWLPRLVVSALWVFFITLYAAADRLPERWRRRAIVVLPILTAGQCLVMTRSIWF